MSDWTTRPLSQIERLAALELALQAISERFDWKNNPPLEPTPERLAVLLAPTDVAEIEHQLLRVNARMYELLGYRR